MGDEVYAILAIFVPIVAAGLVPLAGRLSARARDATALAAGLTTAVLSVLAVLTIRPVPVRAYAWIPFLGIGFDLRIDALGAFIAAIAGTIGFLVILYSRAYMRHAAREGYSLSRYDALVLLFVGAMIGLAFSDSLLAFYIFWETVGLCSFALISYYHRDPKARRAGFKAFAVTRVGDIGLLVAIVAVWSSGGITTFSGLEAFGLPAGIAQIAGIGVLLAAMGKSAQVPLHVWLPDAMEAPTTISALIHAATMVNAGVYLVARTYPAFADLGWWPESLLWIGSITAFLAALGALAESDLKRVLAYSTISQLGYMIAAVGVGAILASQYHLLSQAVFKALLFLGAGAVIQATGTRNLYGMGGLGRSMPLTSRTFLVGVLAMVGIPAFNGFWSKELLIDAVLEDGQVGPVLLLVLTTLVTAAYAWRAYWLVFRGQPRGTASARDAPPAMSSTLVILAAAAATTWLLLGPYADAMGSTMPVYLIQPLGLTEALLTILAWPGVLVPLAVGGLSAYFVFAHRGRFERRSPEASLFARFVSSGFLFDAAYRSIANALASAGRAIRRTQTGDLNWNTAGLAAGLLILLGVLIMEVL